MINPVNGNVLPLKFIEEEDILKDDALVNAPIPENDRLSLGEVTKLMLAVLSIWYASLNSVIRSRDTSKVNYKGSVVLVGSS